MRLPTSFKPRRSRQRNAVRLAAVGALAAAVIVPHVRRQLKIPTAVTVASTISAPLAIAVLWPRSRRRDLGLFAAQMWAFAVCHELPYDNPQRLRERLYIEYPIKVDRWIGRGKLPNARLQKWLHQGRYGNDLTGFAAWTHWFWFIQPYAAIFWIAVRNKEKFPQSARQLAAVFDIGCAMYFLVPTAPPWWAAENKYIDPEIAEEHVQRVMLEYGEKLWGPAWTRIFGTLGSNPWAAMPSLHFATALMAAILLSDAGGKVEGTLGWAYALSLGFALIYLGEHYVTDLLAGAGVVLLARKGEPLVRPLVELINGRLQRLETIAAGG